MARSGRDGYVRKRCLKCGHVGMVPSAQRHCRRAERNAMGRTGFSCWGGLAVVVRPAQGKTLREAIEEMAVAGGEPVVAEKPLPRPQDEAQRKLDRARRRIAKLEADVRDLVKRTARKQKESRRLEVSAAFYAKRASMTDAEMAADKAKRLAARAAGPTRRGIKLKGDV